MKERLADHQVNAGLLHFLTHETVDAVGRDVQPDPITEDELQRGVRHSAQQNGDILRGTENRQNSYVRGALRRAKRSRYVCRVEDGYLLCDEVKPRLAEFAVEANIHHDSSNGYRDFIAQTRRYFRGTRRRTVAEMEDDLDAKDAALKEAKERIVALERAPQDAPREKKSVQMQTSFYDPSSASAHATASFSLVGALPPSPLSPHTVTVVTQRESAATTTASNNAGPSHAGNTSDPFSTPSGSRQRPSRHHGFLLTPPDTEDRGITRITRQPTLIQPAQTPTRRGSSFVHHPAEDDDDDDDDVAMDDAQPPQFALDAEIRALKAQSAEREEARAAAEVRCSQLEEQVRQKDAQCRALEQRWRELDEIIAQHRADMDEAKRTYGAEIDALRADALADLKAVRDAHEAEIRQKDAAITGLENEKGELHARLEAEKERAVSAKDELFSWVNGFGARMGPVPPST
ncbi:hypothetical protein OF83DRAFT_469838 [Amylostereum chailletii]|nr:hypothetical protein OF83DRAFT_469838 [Amylostereum chailletii]